MIARTAKAAAARENISIVPRRTAVSMRNVSCRFGAYTAVDGATIEVGDGEFVSVIGPTGCGKSTILNVVAGLLPPTEGDTEIFGAPLVGLNKHAGYMFQSDSLFPWMTALDNAQVGLEFRGVAPAERRDRAAA